MSRTFRLALSSAMIFAALLATQACGKKADESGASTSSAAPGATPATTGAERGGGQPSVKQAQWLNQYRTKTDQMTPQGCFKACMAVPDADEGGWSKFCAAACG